MIAAASSDHPGRRRVAGDLWAITSYFNPLGYGRRRRNYRIFRDALEVPLVAVELANGRGFELADDDAEIVVRVRQGDVLWQKERLLNLALKALPADCRKVAWIDCDVVYGDDGWAERVSAALDRYVLVQTFSRLHHARREVETGERNALRAGVLMSQTSTASAIAGGKAPGEAIAASVNRNTENHVAGFAWAGRREAIEEPGFYDRCVVGGGDSELLCAAYGLADVAEQMHWLNPGQTERYRAWAAPFHRSVKGSVGFVDGDLHHLWHGDLARRSAAPRHRALSELGYDPSVDVAAANGSGLKWATEKPELHRYVRDFFAARREDG